MIILPILTRLKNCLLSIANHFFLLGRLRTYTRTRMRRRRRILLMDQ